MSSKNKNYADDGWAVWINGDDTSTVYINEWINPDGNNYVDIGLRIRGVMESHMLNVYIPYCVEKTEVEDISLMLKNESIFRAVFSSTGLIDYKKNNYTSELAYNGKTMDLIHISQVNFELISVAQGTLLTFSLDRLHEYLDNDDAYIIFRIPHKSMDEIFRPQVNVKGTFERLRNLITSPVISERYGYSVRINEARILPAEINRIGAFHRQKLKKAVITINMNERYEINESGCKKIRRLEKDLYQDYLPPGFDGTDVITYHWSQSKETNLRGQYNFFFNISYTAISKSSLVVYLILLLIFGAGGNALWTLVQYLAVKIFFAG